MGTRTNRPPAAATNAHWTFRVVVTMPPPILHAAALKAHGLRREAAMDLRIRLRDRSTVGEVALCGAVAAGVRLGLRVVVEQAGRLVVISPAGGLDLDPAPDEAASGAVVGHE